MERLTIDEVIEHCKRKVERMEKFSSREKCEGWSLDSQYGKEYWEHRQVAKWLKKLKAYEQAEEDGLLVKVIRCKDCKYFSGGGLWSKGHWCGRTARPGDCVRVTENDFCSMAEQALAKMKGE
jgi:hypothetical protein